MEIEVNSQRALGETLDKWYLWYELLDEENAVCGRCDVRGETIDELWDFLTGPRAGFASKARVYIDDRVFTRNCARRSLTNCVLPVLKIAVTIFNSNCAAVEN